MCASETKVKDLPGNYYVTTNSCNGD